LSARARVRIRAYVIDGKEVFFWDAICGHKERSHFAALALLAMTLGFAPRGLIARFWGYMRRYAYIGCMIAVS